MRKIIHTKKYYFSYPIKLPLIKKKGKKPFDSMFLA